MFMSANVKLTVWHNWLNYMSAFSLGYAHTNPDTYFFTLFSTPSTRNQ